MPPKSPQLPRRALLHLVKGRRNESALLLLSPLLHPGRGCEGLRVPQISAATPLLACAWSLFAKTSSILVGLLPRPKVRAASVRTGSSFVGHSVVFKSIKDPAGSGRRSLPSSTGRRSGIRRFNGIIDCGERHKRIQERALLLVEQSSEPTCYIPSGRSNWQWQNFNGSYNWYRE
ncbi:hypothetical protein ZIOFF_053843 [Zingiber officinale]|uniref:Uncharacterized protein n=1 Tax=Zingiber officinale TaxID=94328 RepID=A0A8J5F8H2_ZINOF|nr:hypothetical protein ZIOFF_053843 [Zingiber officinale]